MTDVSTNANANVSENADANADANAEANANANIEVNAAENGSDERLDFNREFYNPNELPKAQARIDEMLAIMSDNSLPVSFNFNQENPEIPDGYGILVAPLQKRGSDGNETVGALIAAVPTMDAVLEAEGGEDYIRNAVIDSFVAKVVNAARPRSDGKAANILPFSLRDYMERKRGSDALKAFAKIAPKFVTALREKGLKGITQSNLRQVLSSKAFAESQYAKLPQKLWEGLLDKMIAYGNAQKLDVSLFENWKETRDQVAAPEIGDIDLDDLEIE